MSIKSPERSYHVFYQLCAGATPEQRAALRLGAGKPAFRYLSQSGSYTLADVDDAEQFRHTLDAMRIVGLAPGQVEAVLRTVAAVLHLGNIGFESSASDEAAVAGAGADAALAAAAHLLGVSVWGGRGEGSGKL